MKRYKVILTVKEIHGKCPIYQVGDEIIVEDFYIKTNESKDVCIHALSALSTLLSAFLHGSSAIDLGIGSKEDVGFLQCPDPGSPYTKGGTVIFESRRMVIEE